MKGSEFIHARAWSPVETVEKGINRTLSLPALSKVEVSKRPVPSSNSGPSASSGSEFAYFATVSIAFLDYSLLCIE